MHKILLSLSFVLLHFFCFSQTTIKGKVEDQKGNGVLGASIYILDTYDGTTSDNDGNFTLESEEKGDQILIISMIGFEVLEQPVTLNSPELLLKCVIKEKFNKMKAVQITAGSFEASDTKKAVVLKPLDIVTTAGAAGDISGALQTLPGTSTNGEDGRLFVRGGTGDEVQTYIDGTLVHVPYASNAPNLATRGRFNPFMFEGTVFSTGGYSAEYGQALSSVLILNTKGKAFADQLDVSLMTIGGGLSGIKAWEKGSVRTDFSYFNMAPYMKLVEQRVDFIEPYKSYEGSVSVRQETGKNGTLKFYTNLNRSQFEMERSPVGQELIKETFNLVNDNIFNNLSWKGLVGEKTSMKIGASFTANTDDILIEDDLFTSKLIGSHLKANFYREITEKVGLNAGVEYFYKDKQEEYFLDQEISVYKNGFTDRKTAAYAESNYYLTTRFAIRAGVRAEHSDFLGKSNVAPRISTAYKLNELSQISLAYGMFFQDPNDNYLYASSDLGYEKSQHFIGSYQISNNKGNILRAESYYKSYDALVKELDDFQGLDNSGEGFAYGFELFYKDMNLIKNTQFWISYSFLESKRNFRDYPYEAVPTFINTHNFSLVYKYWAQKWRSLISATYNYASPRRYNDPNLADFNSEETKHYNSFNLSWSYLYKPQTIFYASFSNVFGFQNEFGYEFSDQLNDQGLYEKRAILPAADRFFFIGCFITFNKDKESNQLDKLN